MSGLRTTSDTLSPQHATARPPHRRGDVQVTATATEPASCYGAVVTLTPHWREDRWHVEGTAVAREERDKLRRWDVEAIDTHGVRVVPLSMDTQVRWDQRPWLSHGVWPASEPRTTTTAASDSPRRSCGRNLCRDGAEGCLRMSTRPTIRRTSTSSKCHLDTHDAHRDTAGHSKRHGQRSTRLRRAQTPPRREGFGPRQRLEGMSSERATQGGVRHGRPIADVNSQHHQRHHDNTRRNAQTMHERRRRFRTLLAAHHFLTLYSLCSRCIAWLRPS